MRTRFLTALLLLPTAAAISQTYPTVTLEQHRAVFDDVTAENFDDGGRISHYVFKNMPAFYRMALIARTEEARPLDVALRDDVADLPIEVSDGQQSLHDYVTGSPLVNAAIVLHEGRIVYESYPNMHPWERHFSWSVGKVITSTVLAMLHAEGRVDVDQPVERYLPELSGTAWAGTTVRNVVNMASGIDCFDGDGYQDPDNCIYQLEESLNLTARVRDELPSTIDVIANMQRRYRQGTRYDYRSVDTLVAGLIIERVTDRPLWIAFQEILWDRIGPEADAFHYISESGVAYAAGGMFLRLRDVARFGQLLTPSGVSSALLVEHMALLRDEGGIELPQDRLEEIAERFPTLASDLPTRSAWQWDMVWEDGGMFKSGYGGQGLYVDPDRDLVVAWFGTHDTDWNENELVAVARQLAQSSL